MLLNDTKSELWPIEKIIVDRPSRQRKTIDKDVDTLAEQMANVGQIQPIVIHRDGRLVAGERRLTAAKKLGWGQIRVSIYETLTEAQAFLIEFLENAARKNLTWQDEASAVLKYHSMRQANAPEWSTLATAQDIGYGQQHVSMLCLVARRLDDPDVAGCPTLTGAFNLLRGRAERATAAAQNRGMQIASSLPVIELPVAGTKEEKTAAVAKFLSGQSLSELGGEPTTPTSFDIIQAGEIADASLREAAKEVVATDELILTADFHDWAQSYDGPKFDVLHIDFPYGKNFSGAKTRMGGGAHIVPAYKDSPEVFWQLLDTLLTYQDNFVFPTAHCIFWFDMRFYQGVIDSFASARWKLSQDYPLIWLKPGQGIPADPKRRPVHSYETALLFSRGDRRLARLKSDCFEARVDEKLHMNQKPAKMLQHFLSLVVDEHTAVLDPTCGSGTSLVAARALSASRMLGIESDPSNAEVARFVLARPIKDDNDDYRETGETSYPEAQ